MFRATPACRLTVAVSILTLALTVPGQANDPTQEVTLDGTAESDDYNHKISVEFHGERTEAGTLVLKPGV